MSLKERRRLEVMAMVRDGKLSLARGAGLLNLSVRQARRLWRRYRSHGDVGLVHGLRGKPGNHAKLLTLKQAVLARYRQRYADFGATLAAEKLT